MARFSGKVGYIKPVEGMIDGVKNGIWTDKVIERNAKGDVVRNGSRWENGTDINDNIFLNGGVSIVADPFACENFMYIRYIVWMKQKIKVSSIDVQYPRLVLNLGGPYNGNND